MNIISEYPHSVIILIIFGIIGSLDEFFFHHKTLKLLSRKQSFKENILHNLRSLIYSVIFLSVANFKLQGNFSLVMLLILCFDLTVSIWDILEEPRSRIDLNGLTAKEYLLHMILSFSLGIFYYLYLTELIPSIFLETKLINLTYKEPYLQYFLSFMGLSSFIFFIYCTISLYRESKKF